MNTWGDLKNTILAKLDLDEAEANEMNYLERFIAYANEAMIMICSTIKPKRTFYEFEIHNGKYDAAGNLIEEPNINVDIDMPDNFISFGDDRNTIDEDIGYGDRMIRETCDEDFEYIGYNQVRCFSPGKYKLSYNAVWHIFSLNDDVLTVPLDVLACVPSYVASQCYKVDDDAKAAVFRNEFEILFARIDDTNYKSNKTFKIGGDW